MCQNYTMKINFDIPTDNKYHQYCPQCHSEKINRVFVEDKTFYKCDSCNNIYPRLIVIDPGIIWWVDEVTKEYWHESMGIFLTNTKNEILLFERIIFPFAFTIPSGHLDKNEYPEIAIKREVLEETSIPLETVKLFTQENIDGDQCRRGADNHKWHLFTSKVSSTVHLKINDEGTNPLWLSLRDSLTKKLIFPVRYFLEKYGGKILDN